MFLSLAVGGLGAVLALVMVFADVGWDGLNGGVEEGGSESQPSNVFENIGIFDCVGWRFSPCEGGMTGNEDSGYRDGVETLSAKTANDDGAGIANVAGGDFLSGESFCDRDGTVEVVGVGGAKAGNGLAGLGPGGGEFGVGVDDAAYLREFPVKQGMGVEIAGGTKGAFNNFAVEIRNDEVGWGERAVVNSAGLDDDEGLSAGAIDPAGIAEGMRGEAAAGDFLVGVENLVA
jgi:hypothetical protein